MSESITVITLLLSALDRVHLPALFDRDGCESRRSVLPGARLVKVLVVYQMIGSEKMRGLIRVITENASLQAALGGTVGLNTLSNGLAQRTVEQMVEAWMLTLQVYGPWLRRMGRKFARVAVVDASLIKLSLLSYSWAEYRKQTGAANRSVAMLVMHFGHRDPEMHSHDATSYYAAIRPASAASHPYAVRHSFHNDFTPGCVACFARTPPGYRGLLDLAFGSPCLVDRKV